MPLFSTNAPPTFMQQISEFVGLVRELCGKVYVFGPFLTLNCPKNPKDPLSQTPLKQVQTTHQPANFANPELN